MRRTWHLLIILLTSLVMLSLAWVGYVGTDDQSYANGAIGWLNHFPYVGNNHWALRHTVVIPVAASLAVFGMREISLGAPSAILFLLMLIVNYHYMERSFGPRLAFLSSIFMTVMPLFLVQATFPQDVIVQLFAVSLSFWLFYEATRHERPSCLMFAAGVAAAFAWLTVETAAGLLLFYGILFLSGFGVRRKHYWVMALGFAVVIGIEIGYFTLMTGDPLYRYRIDLHHDAVDRIAEVNAARTSGNTLNLEGNLAVSPLLEPFVALLFNQEFGLLFWVYIPAAIWACRTKKIPLEHRRLLRLLVGLGLVWMAFVSVNSSILYVVPRYYAPLSWVAAIIVVYWLHFLFERLPKLTLFIGVGVITANLFCIYVENKNPLFAERALVDHLLHYPGVVYTDPLTLRHAKLLLEFKGISADRVRSEPAPIGAVFYANSKSIEQCKREIRGCKWPWKLYVPKKDWGEFARIESKLNLNATLVRWLRLDGKIPRDILDRLDEPNPPGVFYLTSSGERL